MCVYGMLCYRGRDGTAYSANPDGALLTKLLCAVTAYVWPVLSVAVTSGLARWYVSVHWTRRTAETLVGPAGWASRRSWSEEKVARVTVYAALVSEPEAPRST